VNEDRLSTLLAERAEGAHQVHPTLGGVESVVARRTQRRRRHRVVGAAAAVVIIAAGVGGAIALSRTADDAVPPVTDGFAPPHEVPAVGVRLDGFSQRQLETGPLDLGESRPFSAAVFRSGDSPTDGFLSVMVEPPDDAQGAPEVRGDPTLDLDGDGVVDAHTGGNEAGMGIGWALADGSIVAVAPDGISVEAAIAYAREIFGPTLDLEDLPAPAGLPERDIWDLPDPSGPNEARVSYETEGGGQRITVLTTNQSGYFDLLQGTTAFGFGEFGFEEVPLGPSFLGPGQAILQDNGDGRAYAPDYALIRTDAGLTIEIVGEDVDADILREVIETGAFVEVQPRSEGPRPTATTSVPATSGTTPGPPPPGVEPTSLVAVQALARSYRFVFGGPMPDVTVSESFEPDPRCTEEIAAYHDLPGTLPRELGWLSITLDRTLATVLDGPVVMGNDLTVVVCQNTTPTDGAVITVPLGHEPSPAGPSVRADPPSAIVVEYPS
jgi:hypothetical protein